MATEVINLENTIDYGDHPRRAGAIIRNGGLVGFPTETVYGVASRGDDPAAVRRLREVKQRAESKPFTVHIADPGQADDYVPDWSAVGRRLARKAWPGPVTLVVQVNDPGQTVFAQRCGAAGVDLLYHGGAVGLRCPLDPIAAEFLRAARVPVVAASANRAGEPPARTADGVLRAFDGKLDLVLDGGQSLYSKPSTVVRIEGEGYRILREGVIAARTLDSYAAATLLFVCSGNTCRSPMAAALARQALARRMNCTEAQLEDRRVAVVSAGLAATDGAPPSHGAVSAMTKHGLDVTGHRSRRLDDALVRSADYVFCMTRAQRDMVIGNHAIDPTRVLTLIDDEDINDPFGGDVSTYQHCAERIAAGVHQRVSELTL